jgi:hypothetical protein
MDISLLIAFGVIAFLSGASVTLFTFWKVKKDAFFQEIMGDFIVDVANNEELQKALYQVGGIIGQGAKVGFGVSTPTGAKNFKQLGVQLLGSFIEGKLKIPENMIPSPSPAPSPTPQQRQNQKGDKFFNT